MHSVKKLLDTGIKLIIIASFLCSQMYLSEIFLYQKDHSSSAVSVASADTVDPWYDTGYLYRKKITINHTKIPNTDQADFPVLISLTDNSLRTQANGGRVSDANGYDIVFALPDSGVRLDHEIESYDGSSGTIVMWVKVPTLSHSIDTEIYIYYGNASIESTQEDKAGVWDTNFKGVWHLKEDPSGTAPQMMDSTTNTNDGTTSGSMASDDLIGGKAAGALSLDGSNDFISGGNDASLDMATQLTMGMWINSRFLATDVFGVGGKTCYGGGAQDHHYMLSTNGPMLSFTIGDGDCAGTGTNDSLEKVGFFSGYENQWVYISATYNAGAMALYRNGVSLASKTSAITSLKASSDGNFNIGRYPNWNGFYLLGSFDEVRVSSVARSADWIAVEYNNQSDTVIGDTHFITSLSSEESYSLSSLSSWGYRKAINIDSSKVSGTSNLSDFPVLISLASDDDLKARAKADGSDIIFASADVSWANGNQSDELRYEIEGYDPATGSLQAWVKIPALYSSNNSPTTTIYMYYGNSGAGGNTWANINGVWDSNYRGVWHMDEDPSGAAPQEVDSTQNSNVGTSNGSMTSSDRVGGKIGRGLDFDAVDDYIDVSSDSSLDITQEITLEGWFNTRDAWNTTTMFGKSRAYVLALVYPNRIAGYLYTGDYSLLHSRTLEGLYGTNAWNHIVLSYKPSYGYIKIYVNGNEPVYVVQDPKTTAIRTNTESFTMGKNLISSGLYNGILDELRISSIARSEDWIKTGYNNQNSPSTFLVLSSEENTTPSVLSQVTPVATPTNDPTPSFTFNSTKAGSIIYGGDCSSPLSAAVVGDNTITFDPLVDGTHSNCTIKVTTPQGFDSNVLAVNSFLIDTTAPSVSGVSDGITYNTEKTITFYEGTATLNGVPFVSGTTVSRGGDYVLLVTDTGGTTTVNFTIAYGAVFIAPPKPSIKGVTITILDDNMLRLSGIPSDVSQITMSDDPDFINSSWEKAEEGMDISRYAVFDKLYVKFRSIRGAVSDVITWEGGSGIGTALLEGDIVKTPDNPDVYIIKYKGGKAYKRLILSPSVFKSYRHLKWSNLKIITQSQMDTFITSNLVYVSQDPNIYILTPLGDTGRRTILDKSTVYDPDSVYEINEVDRGSYISG